MLLETMNWKEVVKEMDADYEDLNKKLKYQLKDIQKQMRRKHIKEYSHVFEWTSLRKNNWIYTLKITKEEAYFVTGAYYYAEKGVKLILALNDQYNVFTSHFLIRFRERLGLKPINIKDFVKNFVSGKYFTNDSDIGSSIFLSTCSCNSQLQNGLLVLPGGIGIGLGYHNEQLNQSVFNTFIPQNLFHRGQKDILKDLLSGDVLDDDLQSENITQIIDTILHLDDKSSHLKHDCEENKLLSELEKYYKVKEARGQRYLQELYNQKRISA